MLHNIIQQHIAIFQAKIRNFGTEFAFLQYTKRVFMKTKPDLSPAGIFHIDLPAIDNNTRLSADDIADFPVLPTRNLVLFPSVASPIKIGRPDSLTTVKSAERMGSLIAIVCQIDPSVESPDIEQLYKIGVIARVIKVLELPDGTTTALVTALTRCEILGKGRGNDPENFPLTASIKDLRDFMPHSETSVNRLHTYATEIKNVTLGLTDDNSDGENLVELVMNLRNMEKPEDIINLVATHIPVKPEMKITMLETGSVINRAKMLLEELVKQEEMVKMARKLHQTARDSFDEQQRRAFLQRQMEAIDQELNGEESEISQLSQRAETLALPDKVKEVFAKELNKLARLNPQTPDYSVQYSYLETVLDLPWGKYSSLDTTLPKAREILNSGHYGLDKVKQRIIEQVALVLNNPDGKSPIICLVGPPGVGKTSLGKSIAEALGRQFQRISLGGLHDEAEIRGHRRTYIGAMPGRIMEAIKRAGTANPVLMLDEIDKIGKDYKGDPEAAMLEVLDSEQNQKFHDNYIDIDFDLSKVLFIATANTLSSLSRPLLDRMEVIDLSGYIVEEKVEIARRHLIPKALKELSLEDKFFGITDEALVRLIEDYTAESGVRQLDKSLRSLMRKIIVKRLSEEDFPVPVTPEDLKDFLGRAIYSGEKYTDNNYPGVVTGLAWTAAGGEILFIESSIATAKSEKLTLTGNLGDVMKESATIALQYIKAHAATLGLASEVFDTSHLHVHVPEGAIPKDGPSAGITMATSILSAFTGQKVRNRVAMTGELTLRGKVLPVGGIKEKILAAKRAGITDIVLSKENRKDIEEIDSRYLEGLEFLYVENMGEVFDFALVKE